MSNAIQNFIDICQWDTSNLLIFSDNVFGTLIYYSHFLALVLALLVGFFVLFRDPKALLNRLLFLIMLCFSLWVFFDLVLWANEKPKLIMFFWSAILLVEPLIYALSVYFIHVFVNKTDVSFKKKIGIFSLLLPVIIFLPTKFTLIGFDLTNCYRETAEGFIATYYIYFIEIIYALWILIFAIRMYRSSGIAMKKQILLITSGLILFLLSFISGNIIGSFTENWTLAQIGLFSLPIFVIFLAYMVLRFKAFNIKAFGAQLLVFALGFLVFGMIFIRSIDNVRLVAVITLFLIGIVGFLLIRGVRKEIEQKEELVKLNIDLRNVIQQRESLVHLVTHKVKGSFTRTKYIFAEMLAGSFGDVGVDLKKMASKGLESDEAGIQTIDLVLNTSNLQSGAVKYDMKKISLKDIVSKTVTEKQFTAESKGLALVFEPTDEVANILGDGFWIKEVVHNLIDNSLKYTQKGSVVVNLQKQNDKVLLSVKDTGVGITPEDMQNLFKEGGRGKDSVKINVDSTGYGLFSVKLIMDAHGGRVWAESEGKGKGSTFFAEFDAI